MKPWDPKVASSILELPKNALSDRRYKGANMLNLMARAEELGAANDPRWLTYNQAKENGWQVKKGSKGTGIEAWKFGKEMEVKNEETGEMEKKFVKFTVPQAYFHTVFHASQIEGIEPYIPKTHGVEWNPLSEAEKVLTSSGAIIHHDQGDRAFYRPSTDEIHLPPREAFPEPLNYYETALHELAHWTGHESRLNRDLTGSFGTESYAREELRAEMASLYLAIETGVPFNPGKHGDMNLDNYAAYTKSWIQSLKNDKNEIFRAAKDAEIIADHLLDMVKEKTIVKAKGNQEKYENDATKLTPEHKILSMDGKQITLERREQIEEIIKTAVKDTEIEVPLEIKKQQAYLLGAEDYAKGKDFWDTPSQVHPTLNFDPNSKDHLIKDWENGWHDSNLKEKVPADRRIKFEDQESVKKSIAIKKILQPDFIDPTKIPVTSIWIYRAEGRIDQTNREITTTSFKEASNFLREQAKTAPNYGYDKTDFKVTWQNGDEYSGRFDMQNIDQFRLNHLETQMKEELEFYAGIRRPSHFKDDVWQNHLSGLDPKAVEERKQWLASCEGLDVKTPTLQNTTSIQEAAKNHIPSESPKHLTIEETFTQHIENFIQSYPGIADHFSYSNRKEMTHLTDSIAFSMLKEGHDPLKVIYTITDNNPFLSEKSDAYQAVNKAHRALFGEIVGEKIQTTLEETFVPNVRSKEEIYVGQYERDTKCRLEYEYQTREFSRDTKWYDIPTYNTPTVDTKIVTAMLSKDFTPAEMIEGMTGRWEDKHRTEYAKQIVGAAQTKSLYQEGKSDLEVTKELLASSLYAKKDITEFLTNHAPNLPTRSDDLRKHLESTYRKAQKELKQTEPTKSKGITI